MEAVALYDFVPDNSDQLTFRKGDELKICEIADVDSDWYTAQMSGKQGEVPRNYIEMKDYTWYMYSMTRQEAQDMLLQRDKNNRFEQPEGAFIVRTGTTQPGTFSLSVKCGDKVQHFKILQDGLGKYFVWVVKFDSINQLVQYHRGATVSRAQDLLLKDMKRQKVVANHNFSSDKPGDLEFTAGDTIYVLKSEPNDPWWRGEIRRGNNIIRGYFPTNYATEPEF